MYSFEAERIAKTVVEAITKKLGVSKDFIPEKDIEDTMPCPFCKTDMSYTVSSYNGHRSAQCKCFGYYVE